MTFGPFTKRRPPPSMPSTGSSRVSMPSSRRPAVPERNCSGVLTARTGAHSVHAVAFEDAKAELLHPDVARLRLDALGAGDDVAHGVEVVGMGVASHSP